MRPVVWPNPTHSRCIDVNTVVETLKQALKSHGLKYRDVANALGLSETSVKRLFSSGHFSLDRLEAICELMEMGFADLVRMMEERRQRIAHLTEEQEQELVANIKLLLVAMCARNHWTFEEKTLGTIWP